MLHATINGKSYEFRETGSILEATRPLDIEVPTRCHDERLKPAGACRLCVVEVEGWSHSAISCHTPLTDGMVIKTETAKLRSGITDFYRTNPVARASAIMAECSQLHVGLKQAAE